MTALVRFPSQNEFIVYTDLSKDQVDVMAKTAHFALKTEKNTIFNPRETDFTSYSVGIVFNNDNGQLFFELVPLVKIDTNKMTRITNIDSLFTKVTA